ncbi:MAG: MASE1 domain-containing protein [Alphaproteobacteria bacterium]
MDAHQPLKSAFLPAGKAGRLAFGAAFVLLYLGVDWVSFVYPIAGFAITPWNPAAGLSLATLLLIGPAAAPLVFAGALLADIVVRGFPVPSIAVVIGCAVVAVFYCLVAMPLRTRLGPAAKIRSVRDLGLLFAGGVAAASLAAIGFVAPLVLFGHLAPERFVEAALRYWVGDSIGVIAFTPLLLRLASARLAQLKRWRRHVAGTDALQAAFLLACLWLVFGVEATDEFKFFYLLFLPVAWIALRRGLTGAAWACLAVQIAVIVSSYVDKNDATVFVQLQALMLTLAVTGQLIGIVVEERRAQEAGQRELRDQMAHLARFSSTGEVATGLAHELNQPLTALVNYLRVAKAQLPENATAETLDALDRAEQQAMRAAEVVRRLRAFLRRGEIRLASVLLRDTIDDSIGLVRARAAGAGVQIAAQLAEPALRVTADQIQLTQVLVNLLNNAIDALNDSPRDKRRIDISARRVGRDKIAVKVADSGPGIAAEQAERIFEPFFTTKDTGMGLGLPISRTLIEAQHGRIELIAHGAQSGASFELVLPEARSSHD